MSIQSTGYSRKLTHAIFEPIRAELKLGAQRNNI